MGCRTIDLGDGAVGIVCGGPKPKACSVPGCNRSSVALCDFPVKRPNAKSQTCDAAVCAGHRIVRGPDRDYCPPHERQRLLDHADEHQYDDFPNVDLDLDVSDEKGSA